MTVDDVASTRPDVDWKLLATDISTRILERARAGLYDLHRIGTVPEPLRRRYFVRAAEPGLMQVHPSLRARITFAHLNLMRDHYPFRHGFDFIFCRNVMIYFDHATQAALVNKFARHLRPGGFLLIGHSESLNNLQHPLRYVQPTIYQRAT
jgi:chemotaxis protein methyltransferase CheR